MKVGGLHERVRRNIRMIRALRDFSEEQVASKGGFTNRQVLNNRISGRTPLDLDDLERIAAALDVTTDVLQMQLDAVLKWIESNPDYKAPRMTKQKSRG